MRMTIICCPFKTSFGVYGSSLKAAIERKSGDKMQWVASNCGCGDPIEKSRQFQIQKNECDFFTMPVCSDVQSKAAWKNVIRPIFRTVFLSARGKRYANMSKNAEVVHFQQILNAFGSKAVFSWLQQPSTASRIVTVHELDGEQLQSPKNNEIYNLADAVIAHCDEMKQHLIRLGVREEKIHIVLHGTDLQAPPQDNFRKDIVFYGGHKLLSGKGIETLFEAMSIIQRKMGAKAPLLNIHGHYGPTAPEEALRLAAKHGVTDKIAWLNHISEAETVRLYQHSQLCILPYTGSFGGAAAGLAAACQLPVVCTRRAGLPDHLGEAGVLVDEKNPEQLAERIIELLNNEPSRLLLGKQLLKRAEAFLQWDVIADQTLKIYEEAVHPKTGRVLERSCA
jgi:glycosyltransferase involved in cell wall biosynthesis